MLSGYKTYIMGAVAIIGAVASFLVGDSTIQQSIALIVPAILAMTVRHGISSRK